jgi:hypothetical protein
VDRTVQIRIQHRPGRESINRLLDLLPPEVVVIEDAEDPPNPMRGYMKCLSGLPDTGHVAVLQDDTVPCSNFASALELIADSNPDIPVSLFISSVPRRTYTKAMLKHGRSRYVDAHPQDLVHVVAVLWPVHKAREFSEWIIANPKRIRGDQLSTSDDANVTRWMQLTSQTIRYTIPSIVQHPDDVPSIVNETKKKDGRDSGRTSSVFIGDEDPLKLDWSR